MFKIRNTDGEIISTDTTLGLRGGTEAVIFISIATSFNGFDKDPAMNGLKRRGHCQGTIDESFFAAVSTLKQSHLDDYQKYFNRVNLNLGKTTVPDLPTDERLKRYAEGKEDKKPGSSLLSVRTIFIDQQFPHTRRTCEFAGIWNPYIRPPGAAIIRPTLMLKRIMARRECETFRNASSAALAYKKYFSNRKNNCQEFLRAAAAGRSAIIRIYGQ